MLWLAFCAHRGVGIEGKGEGELDLRRRTVAGIFWTFGSQLLVFGAQFGTLAVLARLLSEAEMGVATLAMAVSSFSLVFSGLGLSRALVQRAEPSAQDFTTGFWASVAFGAVGWGALAAAAPWLAEFYGEPVLGPLVQVSGAGLVLTALPQVHQARMERALRFRELGVANVFGFAVPYGVASIGAALLGAGVWSPVVGGLVGFVGQGVALARFEGWRPGWGLEVGSLRGMLGFGLGITGSSIVAFVIDNVDYFVLGRVLGAAELGLYTIAFQITAMPRSKVSSAVIKAAFPAFSKIQGDREKLNRAYIKMTSSVAFVTFPMMAGLFVVGGPFVEVVLGARWLAAVPALEILCGAGALMSVRATAGMALNAVGRADLGFYSNLVVLAVAVPLLLWMAPGGIASTAWAVLIVAAVNFLPLQFILGRLTGLRVGELLRSLLAPCGLSLVMAAGVWGALAPLEGAWLRLIVGVVVGVGLYAGLVWALARSTAVELVGALRGR